MAFYKRDTEVSVMKKFGKFVLAGTALLAAVGVAETFRKMKKKKEEDITGDFRKEESPETENGSKKDSGQCGCGCAAGRAEPEQAAAQPEEAARADRRRKVKDLDDDPFCRLFDELCK